MLHVCHLATAVVVFCIVVLTHCDLISRVSFFLSPFLLSSRSVNEVICHGIPDNRPLQDGDILNIDTSAYYNGYHGDVNDTILIGNVDEQGRKLVQVTKEALDEAIKIGVPTPPFLPFLLLVC